MDSISSKQQLQEFLMEKPAFPGRKPGRPNPFTECATNLLLTAEEGFSAGACKDILLHYLGRLVQSDYLPEDRELICDTFFRLSLITGTEIRRELDQFQYSPLLRFLMRIFNFFWQTKRVFEVTSQPCSNCRQPLTVHILEKAPDIPESNWVVVSCNVCGAYNLFSFGPQINRYRLVSFKMIGGLKKSAYSASQAMKKIKELENSHKSPQPKQG